MFIIMPSQFGYGFQVPSITVKAYMRNGTATRGQVVQFDFINTDAATTDNNMDGGDNSGFANVLAISAAADASVVAIVEGPALLTASPSATVADDGLALLTMYGVTQALVFETAGAGAKGDPLYVDSGVSATALVTTPGGTTTSFPQVAILLGTVADADPAILASVWFFGGLPAGQVYTAT